MDENWENWQWVCTDYSPDDSHMNRVTTTYTYYIPLYKEHPYICIHSKPILVQKVATNYHMDVIHVNDILDNIVYFWAPLVCLGMQIDDSNDYKYTYSFPVTVWSKFALPYIDPMSDWDELEDIQQIVVQVR